MKYLLIILMLFSNNVFAKSLKFSFKDLVRVKSSSCDKDCQFYKLSAKNPKCFIQNYGLAGPNEEIIVYYINCVEVPYIVKYQEHELELTKEN